MAPNPLVASRPSSLISRTPSFTRRPSDAWPPQDIRSLPAHLRPNTDETLDLILRQKIYLLQARRGYRANVDSHILANFASSRYRHLTPQLNHLPELPRPRVLDLGAGSGIVSILFCRAHPPSALHLIELQPQLADRALRNLQLNDLVSHCPHRSQSVHVHHHDLADALLPQQLYSAFDVVLCNPPFYVPDSTRKRSKNAERRLAHMESSASLSTFMSAARAACDVQNRNAFIAVIHDSRERQRVYKAAIDNRLAVMASREMCHFISEPSTRILLQLQPMRDSPLSGGPHSQFSPTLKPIVLHPDPQDQSIYSTEIESFFNKLPPPSLRIGRLRDEDNNEDSPA